jgi:DNA polymerase phi
LLYNGDADALSLLEELQICFNSIVDNKLGHDADTDPMVVMAEIFLSFGSKSSKLLRKVAEQVFVVFSGDMTREALHIFIEVCQTPCTFV